jgi:hypothetical protein
MALDVAADVNVPSYDLATQDRAAPIDSASGDVLPLDAGCTSACVVGAKQCGTGGGVQTCVLNGPCTSWSSETACPSPNLCRPGGACTPPADVTSPSVLSVSPSIDASGVKADQPIVITFSEPMSQGATQAAYQSADLPASSVSFLWNSDSTTLTLKPKAPLEYAMGEAGTDFARAPQAKRYVFQVGPMATDIAGNALALFSSSFTTLRRVGMEFRGPIGMDGAVDSQGLVDASSGFINIGDGVNDEQKKGFFSFDIRALPVEISAIESAIMRIYHSTGTGTSASLGNLTVEHVTYTSLVPILFSSPSLAKLNTFPLVPTDTYGETLVTDAFRKDVELRASQASRSQYRLAFDTPTDSDKVADYVTLRGAQRANTPPVLKTTFLVR